MPSGVGNLIWLDEKGINKILRNRYNGEFFRGMRHGLGIFYYANGATYEGEWFENYKEGYAVFVDENGQAMYGFYKKDRLVRRIYVASTLLETLIKKQVVNYGNQNEGREFFDNSKDENMLNNPEFFDQDDSINVNNNNNKSIEEIPEPIQKENSSFSGISEVKKPESAKKKEEINEIEDPLKSLKNNLYMKIVKVKDFIHDEGREKVKKKLCEVLLRHHSRVKDWYRIYSEKNSKEYEEGFFVTVSGFWQLLIDTRLINGRLNYVSFCRLISSYAMRDFEIKYDEKKVKGQIELMKKYDFEERNDLFKHKEEPDFGAKESNSFFIDSQVEEEEGLRVDNEINEKIKFVLVENYIEKKKKSGNIMKDDKVLLQRFFINALISNKNI